MAQTTLTDRAVIRLSGEDVRGFLDGLVTNTLDMLPAYAALLTPQGKVIADFIIWGDGDDVLLDVADADAEALVKRLSMYRLRRAIVIARDEALAVHWSRDGADDPRLPALGGRWIGPPDDRARGWLEHRLRLGVCEGASELGDLLWLECNADELHGVSFTKGCFVGQENTARMNWRAKVNRRLFVVEGDGGERVRVAYPELGFAVVHARVEAVPANAIIPEWLNLAD
ncbi:folate-binding protein [Sphingomonas sp.]|uniref:CAF17-like 4Fe-4S cluster assembly/insertion protein YgfZ n=1 Tax=Sphingomonas sp. TaxID=28214 RepID=UPI00286AEA65|nr:folate-binding protein [Sphingomonas sp.]